MPDSKADRVSRRDFIQEAGKLAAGGGLVVAGLSAPASAEQRDATESFPSVEVAGVRLPRAIIGINSLLGYSHVGAARDAWIRRHFTTERIAEVFSHCVKLGVTAVLGPIEERLIAAIERTQELTGKTMTFVSTTFGSRETTRQQMQMASRVHTPICLLHGAWVDGWEVRDGRLAGIEEYLSIIQQAGIIPGAACHQSERLQMLDDGKYDVQLFATPVNKLGFFMNPSKEAALSAISRSTKPVIAIKPLASGRFEEYREKEWLEWALKAPKVAALCIGFMSEEEAEADLAHVRALATAVAG